MEKIALIEFGESHDEVLYPQYLFLEEAEGYLPILFVSEAFKPRIFDYPEGRLRFFPAEPSFTDYRKLHQDLKAEGIQKVVINTASGKKVRNFVWSKPFAKIEFFGVLHHLRKLESSTTQKLISLKIKRYYFLAEYLKKQAEKSSSSLQFSSFYAGFLPSFPIAESIKKPADEIWVVIPGQLEYKRRDYLSLLDSLSRNPKTAGLKFIVLGKSRHSHGDGARFEAELKARGLEDHFKTWANFVPNEEFYAYLQQADFVLPLIHAGAAGGDLYQKQISGAWNMALAYRIPMLIEQNSIAAEEWSDGAYLYDISEMDQLWPRLPALVGKPLYRDKKWQLAHQAKAYLQFLAK